MPTAMFGFTVIFDCIHNYCDINRYLQDGDTALILACAQGCTKIVDLLLTHPDIEINLQGKVKRTVVCGVYFVHHISFVWT